MALLTNAFRALKPSGKLVITTPNSNSWTAIARIISYGNPFSYSPFRGRPGGSKAQPEHIKEYSVRELHEAIRNGGFELVTAETISPYHHPSLSNDVINFLQETYTLDPKLKGEVHFVVGEKSLGHPRYVAFKPLYDFEERLN